MAGKVVNADILEDHAGKSKGLGEVQFDDQSDAIAAIGEGNHLMYCCSSMTYFDCSAVPWPNVKRSSHDSQNGKQD